MADLGDRHAKEILVDDVDGDGTDELYVSVEGHMNEAKQLVHPVEIRRYDAGTPANGGAVIATLDDRLSRFLTAGDVDGDGKKELVAAAFSSGLWLLRPGADPKAAGRSSRSTPTRPASSTPRSCPTSTATAQTSSTWRATSTSRCAATPGTAASSRAR